MSEGVSDTDARIGERERRKEATSAAKIKMGGEIVSFDDNWEDEANLSAR